MPTTPKLTVHSAPQSSARLVQVSPDDIAPIWGLVRHGLDKALQRTSCWNERDVLVMLLTEQAQLWRYGPTSCITRFVDYPRQRVFELFMLWGEDRETWLPLEEALAAYGKAKGAAEMRLTGRKGWLKVAGWKDGTVEMKRTL